MSGTLLSYGRDRYGDGGRRYCTAERRRHRYSSFSIMKWFRKTGGNKTRDDGSAWFRDDLQRIQQAYVDQESDYAAVTPIARRRHQWPVAAATWSRWSGSTTTVYSFAYMDGAHGEPRPTSAADDVVEYIDAATLPAPRLRPDRDVARGTSTSTARRRHKRIAPPPPPSVPTTVAVGLLSSVAATKTSTQQRRSTTMARKKYRAPQPPVSAAAAAVAVPSTLRPQRRRKKGPAPEPPRSQQQSQPQPQQQPQRREPDNTGGARGSSNVRRKITQYERDRLLERVDKIEKHFLPTRNNKDKNKKDDYSRNFATATPATGDGGRGDEPKPQAVAIATHPDISRSGNGGFVSVAALYTAMAATNLTELDKRAAEICRRKRLEKAAVDAATARPRPATITAEHKNAIVAAVIRKSYPSSTVVDAAFSDNTATADDDKRLVRHKRLEFFQKQNGSSVVTKSSLGTQTTDVDVAATRTPPQSIETSESRGTAEKVINSGNGGGCSSISSGLKILPSEDNNCYQRLMDMEMQSDLVLHNGPFECAVCLCTYDNNGVVLRDCLHVFCRPCLQMTISHSKAEQVECPYMDEQYSCKGVLQHREIKKILDSNEEYERFLQRSVERARQLLAKGRDGGSFQCRRPDCTGWCLIYNKENVVEFKCPVCGTVTCVRCGTIHARNKGCRQVSESYSESDSDGTLYTLESLIDRGDAMPCPGCNTILSKQQGCDWIKCAVCFMEICWATKGPRWGPKGKGDTSAGCMCGIPAGRKCHNDCKYCH